MARSRRCIRRGRRCGWVRRSVNRPWPRARRRRRHRRPRRQWVVKGRRQPVRVHLLEAGGLERELQRGPGPELEEHRAHIALHAALDDGEDVGPAAAGAGAPHRGHRASAGPKHAVHLRQSGGDVRHVHQPERAQRRVERLVRHIVHLFRAEALRVTLPSPRARASSITCSTMRAEMSVASTWPPGPTEWAAGKVTSPVPQAMSITRSSVLERCHLEQPLLRGSQLRGPGLFVDGHGAVPPIALDATLEVGVHRATRR